MTELKIADLLSAEEYDIKRDGLLSIANSDKETRTIEIGKNVSLLFENKATVQSKLQEVLRSANVTTNEEVQEKLSAFNLLLPNIDHLKATMIIHCVKEENLSVPLVVRLAGTNVKEGKKILDKSNLKILSASDLNDAAKKIVEAIK